MVGFKDELKELALTVNHLQDREDREYISDYEAIAAINVLNFAKYNKVPDVFLGCAALNLLSVYAKQKDNSLSFNFLRLIFEVLKGIEDVNQPKTIKLTFDNSDKLSLLIISFWDFQFSFQSMKYTEQVKNLESKNVLKWDGIRKQKCAATIFKFALDNKWISNITLGGEKLRDFIKKELDIFDNEGYSVMDGRFVKVKDLRPATDEPDGYLKNYIRSKLYACQDRPVIISAIFRKVWDKHVTFTSVKPYIPNTKAITICNHVNVYKKDIEKVISIESLIPGERYYIIGYSKPYRYVERMGIQLAIGEGFCPIFGIKEFKKMPVDIITKCHRFSIEEYLSAKQKVFKL